MGNKSLFPNLGLHITPSRVRQGFADSRRRASGGLSHAATGRAEPILRQRTRLGRGRRQQGRVARLGKMIIPGQRLTETLLLHHNK